jgi:hypothetical protein
MQKDSTDKKIVQNDQNDRDIDIAEKNNTKEIK